MKRDAQVRSIVDQIVERRSPGQQVATLHKHASPYATTAGLWELEAALSDGTTLCVVHKASGRRARVPGAPRNVPAFVYDPEREIRVYKQFLEGRELGTPRLFASDIQPGAGRYWIFLERVPGTQLRWTVEPSAWHRAAAWLARAHATLEPSSQTNTPELLNHDARYYRRWLRRAQIFTEGTNRERRTRLAWLARHHESVVDALTGLPPTVIHGEFYPSNILVDESMPDGRISVIDWEMAAVGPAVTDLAALVGGRLAPTEQAALVTAYLGARPEDSPGSPATFGAEALACARLQFALQWMGWSRDWSPPEEQRHDWLAEAVELGETMGW